MIKFKFEPDALEQFTDWGVYDRQKFLKIYDLLKDISRTPFTGIGKPEAMKHNLKGCWSRRIDDKHRLVYRISSDGTIEIISCKGHSDK
ncbi:Txe/YoeB family addiction module toxin [Pedobacter glucosidilyticus]|uniref:Txe/YoeB family addiction module toxin n=1 Tax=Pedobacter glucosidilyticus TaxID=1122941 RepID=UPI0003FC3903|nr:Txe/YoeB family addiction module toxin [Pedobacter glucosidilyticus]